MTDLNKEKEKYLQWHFENWKSKYAQDDAPEFAKTMYDRIYQHFHTDQISERESGFEAWLEAKAQAVPDGWAIVPQELPLDMALKIAKERILEQPPVKDPVLNEILEKAHKENIQSEQCRLMRDYKEMVKRLSDSGAEG
ncbi:hypothetical protein OHW93_12035 [Acinetobacter baumannii]|nr:hypothetical protein [Acinetobacter baumannii]MDC4947195.1 hypothetical protein [Acinetobacter baumannii]MDC5477051.1 hypothetical protein [Acinetobacter baumannii]